MIPVHLIGGKQFIKARTLMAEVVFDGSVFRMQSSSGGEEDHLVRFDSLESPLICSCTCKAGRTGTPCWAMARGLDALAHLSIGRIHVRTTGAVPAAAPVVVGPPSRTMAAGISERGELVLMTRSATPLAGMVLNVP
jgi:hypothetical protein